MADPVVYPGLASNLTLFVLSNPMARCIIWSSRGWPKTFLMNPTTKTLFNIHVFISIFRSWSWSINVFTRSARAWKSSQCITNQVEFMENFFDFFQTLNPLAVAKEKKMSPTKSPSEMHSMVTLSLLWDYFFPNHGVSILHFKKSFILHHCI